MKRDYGNTDFLGKPFRRFYQFCSNSVTTIFFRNRQIIQIKKIFLFAVYFYGKVRDNGAIYFRSTDPILMIIKKAVKISLFISISAFLIIYCPKHLDKQFIDSGFIIFYGSSDCPFHK